MGKAVVVTPPALGNLRHMPALLRMTVMKQNRFIFFFNCVVVRNRFCRTAKYALGAEILPETEATRKEGHGEFVVVF